MSFKPFPEHLKDIRKTFLSKANQCQVSLKTGYLGAKYSTKEINAAMDEWEQLVLVDKREPSALERIAIGFLCAAADNEGVKQ